MHHPVSPQPTRTRLSRVSAVLLVLCLGLVGCMNDRKPGSSKTVDAQRSSGQPEADATDGGDFQVDDFGFTQLQTEDSRVSFAVTLTNTSKTDAVWQVIVRVRLFDSNGESLTSDKSPYESIVIANIRPEGRSAATGYYYPDQAMAAHMEVTVENSLWLPADEVPTFADTVTSGVTFTPVEEKQETLIEFRVSADQRASTIGSSALVVFRDSAGEVLGGTVPLDGQLDSALSGGSKHSIQVSDEHIPFGADAVTTEVFIK